MSRRMTKHPEDLAEVNLTPLLDVIFILLIFFIVTSTFLNETGLSLVSPSDTLPKEQRRTTPTLVLSVQDDGFVRVDNVRLIDPRSVAAVIEEFKARQPHGVVLVNAAPESRSEDTVIVLDQARQAGVEPAVALQRSEP